MEWTLPPTMGQLMYCGCNLVTRSVNRVSEEKQKHLKITEKEQRTGASNVQYTLPESVLCVAHNGPPFTTLERTQPSNQAIQYFRDYKVDLTFDLEDLPLILIY